MLPNILTFVFWVVWRGGDARGVMKTRPDHFSRVSTSHSADLSRTSVLVTINAFHVHGMRIQKREVPIIHLGPMGNFDK